MSTTFSPSTQYTLGPASLTTTVPIVSPYNSIYGDGSDGNVTIAVNTVLSRDMYYNNLTVNSGVALSPNGFRIFVLGKLNVVGGFNIVARGADADGNVHGAAGSTGTLGAGAAGGAGGSSLPVFSDVFVPGVVGGSVITEIGRAHV